VQLSSDRVPGCPQYRPEIVKRSLTMTLAAAAGGRHRASEAKISILA
jgi:hypothetical protein